MKKYIILSLTALAAFCTLFGCGSARQVTQLVHDIQRDTVYLSNIQYDSTYIYQDRLLDRSKDTVYLKDVSWNTDTNSSEIPSV